MRIAHVVETLERGGLERVVIDLALAQRDAGHECRVACLFQPGALAQELSTQGIEVHACGKHTGVDVPALSRLRAWLRRQHGGVLHTHNATAHYHGVLAAAGLPFDRIVNTRHGMGVADPHSRREWLYRRTMPHTDVVAAVCEAARVQFAAQGVRPRTGLAVIRNGIRTERFAVASPETRRALAVELGFDPRTRLIGTVGRLNPVKDQAALLQAFALVHRDVPDCALVLVGDGALRAELEAQARAQGVAGAVRFLGDRSDVARLLQGLMVFVLSSRSEGYSVALLEACATGLPIAATDVGGNREIVGDGVNGRLVASGDIAGLAQAMADLLRDPLRADAMGRAGRRWALAEGSLQMMLTRYERVYAGGREPW